MRQLGTLPTEAAARRLAAYLVTQRIDSEAEQEAEGWVVWVRDEDQLATAREALAHFRAHPDDARYDGAQRTAENLRREEAERRRKMQKNVVEMRGRWGTGGIAVARRCPLVMLMIAGSVLVFLFSQDRAGGAPDSPVLRTLLFVNPRTLLAAGLDAGMFLSIRAGELWRLVTPIFIHYGIMHIVFNMFVLYALGSQIEHRRGSWRFAALVLTIAVLSNVAQALWGLSFFGGMSGVGYGLFGFVWMKVRYDNSAGYHLDPQTVFIMLLWFVLCILAAYPPLDISLGSYLGNVANAAHAAGLFVGMAIGCLPLLRKA